MPATATSADFLSLFFNRPDDRHIQRLKTVVYGFNDFRDRVYHCRSCISYFMATEADPSAAVGTNEIFCYPESAVAAMQDPKKGLILCSDSRTGEQIFAAKPGDSLVYRIPGPLVPHLGEEGWRRAGTFFALVKAYSIPAVFIVAHGGCGQASDLADVFEHQGFPDGDWRTGDRPPVSDIPGGSEPPLPADRRATWLPSLDPRLPG